MKSLTPWESFQELRPLREVVDQLLEDCLIAPSSWLAEARAGKGGMALDVYEEGNNVIVRAALPGLKPDEISMHVRGDVLTITGERKEDRPSRRRNYQLHEQTYGRLQRSVTLPMPVDADKAEAVFADGVLTVTLPKSGETATKQITLKGAGTAPVETSAPAADAQPDPATTGEAPVAASEVTPA